MFIETNIRSVFIHFFFSSLPGQESSWAGRLIHDQEIFPLIEKTLDAKNPREWYWALMDYGTMLKEKYKNPNKKSVHYHIQTPFKGSNREVRGKILKQLINSSNLSFNLSLTIKVVSDFLMRKISE